MHVEKHYRVLESHLEGDVTVIDKVELMGFSAVPAGTKLDLSLLGKAEIMSEHEQDVEANEDGSVALPQTGVQLAILERLAQRFTHFTFKAFPGIEVDGVVVHPLSVQRGPKDEWYKLNTAFPAIHAPATDEQTMRQIERELHSWGDGAPNTAREESDGTPQYPKIQYPKR